jgi:hypothetical protein
VLLQMLQQLVLGWLQRLSTPKLQSQPRWQPLLKQAAAAAARLLVGLC